MELLNTFLMKISSLPMLKYGLIGGFLSILLAIINWTLIARYLGYNASVTIGYLSILISLSCIPFGLIYFRDKLNMGSMSFVEGLKIGIGISLIMSVLIFIYNSLFFLLVGDDYDKWRMEVMSAAQRSQVEQQMAQIPEVMAGPWMQGLVTATMVFMAGLIVNLISTMILKKSNQLDVSE